ncbi:unnamed protein product [Fusarium fujikuroi]|uniref:Uncharacterized protein n=1 Tax=Fusarium fujikuroi TaxID=5127 RepID=A0A9Q9RLE6_FUSFU|nr:unnamed protein product [Fusarium fujikuroi]VTT68376.1 unnamed protein product [Fusarium fujikuroi]VZI15844.1 unnamed protein product [Fusarium fujikuroi]
MSILLQDDISKYPRGLEVGDILLSVCLSLTLLTGVTSLETSARIPVSSQDVPNQTRTLIDDIGGKSKFLSITGAHGLVHLTVVARSRLGLNSHLLNASDEHLSTVVARGEVSVSVMSLKNALFSYIKHVGRHLEQLALFAFPSIRDEQLEDDADSGEQNNEASKLEAISVDKGSFEASLRTHE